MQIHARFFLNCQAKKPKKEEHQALWLPCVTLLCFHLCLYISHFYKLVLLKSTASVEDVIIRCALTVYRVFNLMNNKNKKLTLSK